MTTTESPTVSEEVLNNRRNWIHALESDDYVQGRRALATLIRYRDGDWQFKTRYEYCCIGVACKVVGELDDSDLDDETSSSYLLFDRLMDISTTLDPDYMYSGRSTATITNHLMTMNDTRKRSFKFIARFLRVLWGIKD